MTHLAQPLPGDYFLNGIRDYGGPVVREKLTDPILDEVVSSSSEREVEISDVLRLAAAVVQTRSRWLTSMTRCGWKRLIPLKPF